MGRLAIRRLSLLSCDELAYILARSTAAIFDEELQRSIGAIVDDVRCDGDAAVSRALACFDEVECPPDRLRVRSDEIARARASLDPAVVDAIRVGIGNIRAFNEHVVADTSWRGVIVADESADPRVLAADLLNEAEHGPDSASLLLTPSEELAERVSKEVERQLDLLPEWRRTFAESSISRFGGAFLVKDLSEAAA